MIVGVSPGGINVLIAGGMSTPELEERTRSAEIFDPKSGTFAPTGSPNAARGDNDAAVLPDGGVLVFGNTNYADCCAGPILNSRTAEVFR